LLKAMEDATGVGRGRRMPSAILRGAEDSPSARAKAAATCTRPLRGAWHEQMLPDPIARAFFESQIEECSGRRMIRHQMHEAGGMGHDIYDWSGMLCYAHNRKATLVANNDWVWSANDWSLFPPPDCGPRLPKTPVPRGESNKSYEVLAKQNIRSCALKGFPNGLRTYQFASAEGSRDRSEGRKAGVDRRYGAIVFLLRYLPAHVIQTACAAQAALFGGFVPEHKDLITVHMRRGDKCIGVDSGANSTIRHCEMHYISAQHFIEQVKAIVERKRIAAPSIFLTTEDRGAIEEFIALAKAQQPHWRVDYYERAVLPSNTASPGVEVMKTPEAKRGEAALPSLVALVLSLEADSYILTRRSDWSVNIDALRQGRIDHICHGCTDVVDLSAIGVSAVTSDIAKTIKSKTIV